MDNVMKRINFFQGFATTAEDWQAAEAYHIEKRKLHNKYFHSPGVILECLKGLAVIAIKEGSALRVEPGMALDGEGRELYLPQPIDLDVNLRQYRGTTIYVAIEYGEQPVDHRPNKFNSDYEGHAFISEFPAVTIARDQPDNKLSIELARIDLAPEVTRIKDPTDPTKPKKNEINRLFVRKTGQFRAQLEDVADVVLEGEVNINGRPPGDDAGFGESLVLIERVSPSHEHRFYIASVSPFAFQTVDAARWSAEGTHGLSWQILAQWREADWIEYRLRIVNSSQRGVQVAFKVYRFR